MKQTIDYIEQYRLHYERGGYGNNDQTVKAKHKIRRLVAKTGAVRLLDYGCGECRQYSEHQLDLFWGIYVTKYDPAIPEVSETPKRTPYGYCGVICVDVLEHVPEHDLERVLTDIFSYAGKFVYLQIATSPAQQILPNGENAHCTLKTHDEWVERIKPLCGGSIVVKVVTWGQSEGETNLGQIEQKPSPLVKTATVVANGPSAYNADLWLEGDVVTINDTIQLLDSSVKPAFCFFTHGYVLGEFKDRWADVQTFVSPTQPFGDLPHGFPIQKWNHIPDYACGGSVGRLREQITTGGIAWSHTTTGAVHYLAKHGYQKIRIIGHDNGVEYFDTARRFGEMRNYSEWRDVTERLCGLLTEYYGCEIEWYERQPDDLW